MNSRKYIENQLKKYARFERKHIEYALKLVNKLKKELKNELTKDLSDYKTFQVKVRKKDLDRVYRNLSAELKFLQKKYTEDGIQLGILDTLKYTRYASEVEFYGSDQYIRGVSPRINERAL